MVTEGRRCSECGCEMLLDHVSEKGGVRTFFYSCINPGCKECGKAYTATGKETGSTIKGRDKPLF